VQAQPKTTAELLIGMWKMTNCDLALALDVDIMYIFAENGEFEWHTVDDRNGHRFRVGTYRLEGNTIHFSAKPSGRYDANSWDDSIETLTEDHLVLVGLPRPLDQHPRTEYKRTQVKLVGPLQINVNDPG